MARSGALNTCNRETGQQADDELDLLNFQHITAVTGGEDVFQQELLSEQRGPLSPA
jgi:hypothetical protein